MLQQALHELRAAGDYDPNSAYVQIIWNGLPRVANDIFFKKFTHQLIQLYPKQSQLYEALGLIYISKAENAHQPISENILKQVISLRRKGRDLFDAGATEVPTLKLTAFPFNARFLVTTPWNGEVWSHVGIQGKHCYDLMGVDEQGKVIKAGGDGKSNEDFHTFGIELMAVANGTVVSATMGSSDQPPGERNWQPGNTVMIRHVDGSYAYYDHLKYPGPSVKVGEPVRQGQVIGHMGNTGASGAPHLHFCLFRDVNSTRVTIPYTFPTRNITSEKRSGQSQGPYRKGDIVIP
ncbi:MAG: M23 family metallopeptidase [Leptospiraceae bacterium]|nr:M23 family metallopeptidase [Leptospiraceae bacterium]